MKTQSTNNTRLLRIINREIMENDYDSVCYREAQRRGDGGSHSTIRNYISLRLQVLTAANIGSSESDLRPTQILTTDQCHKRLSSRTSVKESRNTKEVSAKHLKLELWISAIVLLVGSISAVLCLWSLSGNTLTSMPYMALIPVVVLIQFIPWMITKTKICTRLTATSALCILVALISVGSGVKLLKSNPVSKIQAEVSEKELVNTITITPASIGTDKKQSTASYNYK